MSDRGRLLRVGQDVVSYGVLGGLSQATGILLVPIFTRVFSTAEYGSIEIVISVTALLATLCGLALPSAMQRFFFEWNTRELVSTTLAVMAITGLVLVLVGSAVAGPVAARILGDATQGPLIVLGCVVAVLYALEKIPKTALRMQRQPVRYQVMDIVYSLANAALALWLVLGLRLGVTGVLLAIILAAAVRFVLGTVWIRQHLTTAVSLDVARRALRFSLPMLPGSAALWINAQIDRFMLLVFFGLQGVGVFAAAAKVGVGITLLVTAFQNSWMPHAMESIKLPPAERDRFYSQVLTYYTGAFAAMGILLTGWGPEIVALLAPREYHDGWVVIPWVVAGAAAHGAAAITNLGVLISEKTSANIPAAGAGTVLNVIASLALIAPFGLMGIAFGRFVGSLAFAGMLWFFSVRYSGMRLASRPIVVLVIAYVVTCAAIVAAPQWVSGWPGLAVRVGIAAAAVFVVILPASKISLPAAVGVLRTFLGARPGVPPTEA